MANHLYNYKKGPHKTELKFLFKKKAINKQSLLRETMMDITKLTF